MSSTSSEFGTALEAINIAINNLKKSMHVAGKSRENVKVVSLVSRLIEFLESTARILKLLSDKVSFSGNGINVLAPYTYILRAGDELVVMRSRPEHVIVTIKANTRELAIKTRHGKLVLTPRELQVQTKGFNVTASLEDFESIKKSFHELSSALKNFEVVMYRRFIPYFESLAKRR